MIDRNAILDECASLPGAELSYPFGAEAAVFKVGGKMFAVIDLDSRFGRVTLKADPDDVIALVAAHSPITPGYHTNKRHWISIELDEPEVMELPEGLAAELVRDSHALVVATLPVRVRAGLVGPETT